MGKEKFEDLIKPPEHILRAREFIEMVEETFKEEKILDIYVYQYQESITNVYDFLLNPPVYNYPVDETSLERAQRSSDEAEIKELDRVDAPVHIWKCSKNDKHLSSDIKRVRKAMNKVRRMAGKFSATEDKKGESFIQEYDKELGFVTRWDGWFMFTPNKDTKDASS